MIKYSFNTNKLQTIEHIINLYSTLQNNDRYKLSDFEVKFLSYIIFFYDKDPFKGSARESIMKDIGVNSSSMYSNTLNTLSMKAVLIKEGRGKYKLNDFFNSIFLIIKNEAYKKTDNKITFQIELNVNNEQ